MIVSESLWKHEKRSFESAIKIDKEINSEFRDRLIFCTLEDLKRGFKEKLIVAKIFSQHSEQCWRAASQWS